ncbi:MAG: polyprenyl synthetase family protein [Alphaproteobacteria bacterium]
MTAINKLTEMLRDEFISVNEVIMEQMQSDVQLIPDLAGYLIASGGKRIRPLLTLASARLCGFDAQGKDKLRPVNLAACVEFIHTATLLHDDVVDESELRRGKETANAVWSNQASVLVGDFLFSRAFQLMVADGSLEVLKILSDASAIIAEGEVHQLMTTNDLSTSLESYLEVIEAKTAVLFAAACEVGAVVSKAGTDKEKALRDYGTYLGVAFQLVDDLLDYSADQIALGKTIGDDFREGKMTLPIITAIQSATPEEKEFWERTVGETQQTDRDFDHALALVNKYNGLETTRQAAVDYTKKAKECLKQFDDSDVKTCMVELVEFVVERAY